MEKQIAVRAWRVVDVGEGVMVFVDPRREHFKLFEGPDSRLGRLGPPTDPVEAEVHGYVQAQVFPDA